jgi:hypothetical protein
MIEAAMIPSAINAAAIPNPAFVRDMREALWRSR